MTDSSEANLFRKLEEEVLGSKPEPNKNVQSWSTINYFKRKVSRKSSKIEAVKRERLMKNALDVPLIVLQRTKKVNLSWNLGKWTLLTYTDREIFKIKYVGGEFQTAEMVRSENLMIVNGVLWQSF